MEHVEVGRRDYVTVATWYRMVHVPYRTVLARPTENDISKMPTFRGCPFLGYICYALFLNLQSSGNEHTVRELLTRKK
jgi:hypothetical protein